MHNSAINGKQNNEYKDHNFLLSASLMSITHTRGTSRACGMRLETRDGSNVTNMQV